MAENKKSFILYTDLIDNIDHLTNEEKGILFTHLLDYVNDKKPVLEDRLILTAWKPIERQLKRDLKKFEDVKAKRSDAGKESARLRALKKSKKESANPTSVESVQQCLTNPTDNVNDNDNDNDNEIIDKSITINNKSFLEESLISSQWIETTAMQNQIDVNCVRLFLNHFNDHLITMEEQKKSIKEYKQHYVYWLKKQDLSHHRAKVIGKTNQI